MSCLNTTICIYEKEIRINREILNSEWFLSLLRNGERKMKLASLLLLYDIARFARNIFIELKCLLYKFSKERFIYSVFNGIFIGTYLYLIYFNLCY